jgi:site-specific recombinase XerD
MIARQQSSPVNYRYSRASYYSTNPKNTELACDGDAPEIFSPRSKLVYIQRSLQKLSDQQLIGVGYVRDYLLSQYRRNLSLNTIRTNFGSIYQFLKFLKRSGHQRFEKITCDELGAYIEYEQDQGKKPTTVNGRLRCLKAFFNFHIDRGRIDAAILKRKLRIKLPQRLPRAIDPQDVHQLLAVINRPRDRALLLTLLRTGMRIGELLSTTVSEVNLSEKRIEIYQAHKNLTGRVVYLSADAIKALKKWMNNRDTQGPYLFYGHRAKPLSYEAARAVFHKYLAKAGLSHKGYTLHCLRHTFASELLNAGMRLECLQQLLGHSDIEMTRVYARLTDITRRDEYFKAMSIIEKGGINGHYRRDH